MSSPSAVRLVSFARIRRGACLEWRQEGAEPELSERRTVTHDRAKPVHVRSLSLPHSGLPATCIQEYRARRRCGSRLRRCVTDCRARSAFGRVTSLRSRATPNRAQDSPKGPSMTLLGFDRDGLPGGRARTQHASQMRSTMATVAAAGDRSRDTSSWYADKAHDIPGARPSPERRHLHRHDAGCSSRARIGPRASGDQRERHQRVEAMTFTATSRSR